MGKTILPLVAAVFCVPAAVGANVREPFSYAWAENTGWLQFAPNEAGAHVTSEKLTGYAWSTNIGWISLSCEATSSCGSVSYGIENDGEGNLSGYAWSENAGWINFRPMVAAEAGDFGVKIDSEGVFSGYAWGENIGWINFNSAELFGAGARACKVTIGDLAVLADYWLQGCGPGNDNCGGADLAESNLVDLADFAVLAFSWLDYCPGGWSIP